MTLSSQTVRSYQRQLKTTVQFLKKRFGPSPSFAVVFGSGLGGSLLKRRKPDQTLAYSRIPHFGKVSVEGHAGSFHFYKKRKEKSVSAVFLQGRRHFYEGAPLEQIVFPFRALALWGVKKILLTNSSGSLRKDMRPGDLVWIKDHINLMGVNPLRGPNLEMLGPRFPALSDLYDNAFSRKILQWGRRLGISMTGGVYVAIAGPSYETHAEILAYRKLGGDLIGMSTVPEAIASTHAGMEVAALAAVTNSCLERAATPSHEEVLQLAQKADKKLAKLLLQLLDVGFK